MTDKPGSIQALQTEHEELRALIERLHQRLTGAPWQDPMVPSLLDSLVLHLDAHFQYEESDGCFEEWVELAPRVANRTEALVRDHRRLLAMAHEMANQCRQGPRSTATWKEIGDSFERLRQDLLEHEREEHDLLHEVYHQDVGNKD